MREPIPSIGTKTEPVWESWKCDECGNTVQLAYLHTRENLRNYIQVVDGLCLKGLWGHYDGFSDESLENNLWPPVFCHNCCEKIAAVIPNYWRKLMGASI